MNNKHESEARHRALRRNAYKIAEEEFKAAGYIEIRLTEINDNALSAVDSWVELYVGDKCVRQPSWSWRTQLKKFRRRPRRVEVALWYGGTVLCGLALGRVSDQRIIATIHFLEGRPGLHPLSNSIALLSTRFLAIYGALLGCHSVSIESPIPALVDRYVELGFNKFTKRGGKVIRLVQSLKVE